MITDKTYFEKNLTKLPQSKGLSNGVSSTVKTYDEAELDDAINFYEPEIMERILGSDIYAEFVSGIAVTPTPDEKWVTLRNKFWDVTNKRSPIANYIFFNIIPSIEERLTRGGSVVSKIDESSVVSAYPKQMRAWNDMVEKLEIAYEWLIENRATYEHDDYELELDYNLLEKEAYGI